jgi:hypothetical protein
MSIPSNALRDAVALFDECRTFGLSERSAREQAITQYAKDASLSRITAGLAIDAALARRHMTAEWLASGPA